MIGIIIGGLVFLYVLFELYVLIEARLTARRVSNLETRVKVMEKEKYDPDRDY